MSGILTQEEIEALLECIEDSPIETIEKFIHFIENPLKIEGFDPTLVSYELEVLKDYVRDVKYAIKALKKEIKQEEKQEGDNK